MSKQNSLPHHEKHEYCDTRPKYRRGKKRTSVRVFTVNLESKFLLVIGIPAIGLEKDLLKLFSSYGTIEEYKELKDYVKEDFTHVYLLKYQNIQPAKTAKKKLDEHYFFGAVLHVCYAPEYETLEDVREKIIHRRQSVTSRVKFLEKEAKEMKRKKGKKVKPSRPSSKSNSKPPTSGEISSNKVIPSDEIGPSIVPVQPRIEINIPLNQMGIPLSLPPPPPPNMISQPRFYSSYQPPFNQWNQGPIFNQSVRQFEQRNVHPRSNVADNVDCLKQYRGSNPLNSADDFGPSTSKKLKLDENKPETPNINFNRKPPKFKTKSGYFHQKVLDVLVQKQVVPAPLVSQNIKSNNKMEVPRFLPRKVELKQIEQMNEIELNEDGSLPLLGKFVSEQKTKSEDNL